MAVTGNATEAAARNYNVANRNIARVIASQNLDKPTIRTALDAELAGRGLDEIAISEVIADVLNNGTPSEKLRAVELLVRLRGDEPPRKKVNMNLTFTEHVRRSLEHPESVRAEQEEREQTKKDKPHSRFIVLD